MNSTGAIQPLDKSTGAIWTHDEQSEEKTTLPFPSRDALLQLHRAVKKTGISLRQAAEAMLHLQQVLRDTTPTT